MAKINRYQFIYPDQYRLLAHLRDGSPSDWVCRIDEAHPECGFKVRIESEVHFFRKLIPAFKFVRKRIEELADPLQVCPYCNEIIEPEASHYWSGMKSVCPECGAEV